MTGPRRLQGHSQSAALLAHAQWAPGCEATSYAGKTASETSCGEDTAGPWDR
ncbi:unnamed protein product [Staurois parvus]|uniref:Uncharacterized protein n=1 Tax=Staurois parvus TaxID=386267 RepID=A0ABN9BJQ6_9NEOB|nr:unnamed protein product [Staurois parvus]